MIANLTNQPADLAQASAVEPAQQAIRIRPGKVVKALAEAAKLAGPSELIEVDSGDYAGDISVWKQEWLTIFAVGGRVKLRTVGAAVEDKANWVVRRPRH